MDTIHCRNCGLVVIQRRSLDNAWTHADGYRWCPEAFGTWAEPEDV